MKVLITGGSGMLARALIEEWAVERPEDVVISITRDDADLRDPAAVNSLFGNVKNPVMRHLDAVVQERLPGPARSGADRIDGVGLFVGNHHYPIREQIQLLADVLDSMKSSD